MNIEKIKIFVQTINILIVNQSVIDMCASFLTLLTAAVEVDGTRMSRDSIRDQFVCRVWLTRLPVWVLVDTSTYSIFLTALERYVAVIYKVWYHNNVRAVSALLLFSLNEAKNFSNAITSSANLLGGNPKRYSGYS